MGQSIHLNTTRLHCIGAYLAQPTGTPRGGIVVVQEIFGVNAHIRAVTDRFAEAGYTAIAPCFFDHVESGVELGYDEAGLARGRTLVAEVGIELAVDDVASAAESIAESIAGPGRTRGSRRADPSRPATGWRRCRGVRCGRAPRCRAS